MGMEYLEECCVRLPRPSWLEGRALEPPSRSAGMGMLSYEGNSVPQRPMRGSESLGRNCSLIFLSFYWCLIEQGQPDCPCERCRW